MKEQNWTSFDGLNLYAVLEYPLVPPKAVLAFVHGHGSHCRRFEEWFGSFVREKGKPSSSRTTRKATANSF